MVNGRIMRGRTIVVVNGNRVESRERARIQRARGQVEGIRDEKLSHVCAVQLGLEGEHVGILGGGLVGVDVVGRGGRVEMTGAEVVWNGGGISVEGGGEWRGARCGRKQILVRENV